MPDNRKFVDNSFSRKTLTGESDVEIDISKITISPSGNVQPKDSSQSGAGQGSDSGQSQGSQSSSDD